MKWSNITPEGYSRTNNAALFIFNFSFQDESKINNSIKFIIGKLVYSSYHLKEGCKYNVNIDLSGQSIDSSMIDFIKSQIYEKTLFCINKEKLNIKFFK